VLEGTDKLLSTKRRFAVSLYSDVFHFMTAASGAQWKFKSPENMQFYLKYWRPGLDQRPPPALFANSFLEQRIIAGRPVFTLRSRQRVSRKHIVFLHGGSFVNPMGLVHWQFIQRLMQHTGCDVSAPLYGLAPEYNFRDAYELLHQHYLELLEEKVPEDIILMGDSAGGGLVLGFAQWASEQALPQPGGVVMISPWLDITLSNPAIENVQPDDAVLAVPGNREAGRLWAAGEDPNDPRLSPIHGTVTDLPPLCLLVGTHDILMPDARRLLERVHVAGTHIHYYETPGMYHLWALHPTPEGFEAMEQIQDFVAAPDTPADEAHARWYSMRE
jgi:monoterpene epsilon-lactone hydrolase